MDKFGRMLAFASTVVVLFTVYRPDGQAQDTADDRLSARVDPYDEVQVRPDVIQLLVASYGDVRPKLVQRQPGFPTADSLKAVIAEGQRGYGMAADGAGKTSPGAALIIKAAGRPGPRPLWVLAWGPGGNSSLTCKRITSGGSCSRK
jgi:Protein of unknown function (DUF1593)